MSTEVVCPECGATAKDQTNKLLKNWYCANCGNIWNPLIPAPDPVNHPPHYLAHPSGIECITVTEHFNFNLGNAIKYIWRSGEKGQEVQDLEKALWYLQRELSRLKGKSND